MGGCSSFSDRGQAWFTLIELGDLEGASVRLQGRPDTIYASCARHRDTMPRARSGGSHAMAVCIGAGPSRAEPRAWCGAMRVCARARLQRRRRGLERPPPARLHVAMAAPPRNPEAGAPTHARFRSEAANGEKRRSGRSTSESAATACFDRHPARRTVAPRGWPAHPRRSRADFSCEGAV